jgi:hypothetical protein
MKFSFYSLLAFVLLTPAFVFAQTGKVYSPLVNIPSQGNSQMTFEAYINFLYGMSISIAALLAVVKIVIAGAKYMLSDVISNKSEAISDIQGAILGLLLIISAVVILELINPNLTAKSITFPELQSKKPNPSPVQSANPAPGGQTPAPGGGQAQGGGQTPAPSGGQTPTPITGGGSPSPITGGGNPGIYQQVIDVKSYRDIDDWGNAKDVFINDCELVKLGLWGGFEQSSQTATCILPKSYRFGTGSSDCRQGESFVRISFFPAKIACVIR